jgi:ABC-type Fe3+ transport system permease subunit
MAVAAIEPFDISLVEAARTLGASPTFCFLRVVGPLLAPTFVVAGALVLVTSLGEFVTSILLYMPANIPIAVKINMEWRGSVGAAFAYSMLLMVIVAAAFVVSRRLASRPI